MRHIDWSGLKRSPTAHVPLALTEALAASAHVVASAEHLVNSKNTREGGFNDWSILRDAHAHRSQIMRRALDIVGDRRVTICLHASRLLAGAALLMPSRPRVRGTADAYLACTSALLLPRHALGSDGSDHAALHSSAAAALGRLLPSPRGERLALEALAVQACIAYGAAGWVKMFHARWRDGSAFRSVVATAAYGHPRVASWSAEHPRRAAAAALVVLAGECLFPLTLMTGPKTAGPLVAGAACFHAVTASVMGLNRFATAFASFLPAVHFAALSPQGRDRLRDVFLLGCSAVLTASAISGACRSTLVRRIPTAPMGSLRRLVTPAASSKPLIVLLHGLASTPEHFGRLIEEFAPKAECWAPYRAGYGPSSGTSTTPSESAKSIGKIIERAARDRGPVLLIGHSLGGWLARLIAESHPHAVAGVVYLDSSHSGQSTTDGRLREEFLTERLSAMRILTRLGLGWLLERPQWLSGLPADTQASVLRQYRDARLWSTAHREWQAVREEFRAMHERGLVPSPVPALVISAESTVRGDRHQAQLHEDLTRAHMRARATRSCTIRGATHDSLLTEPTTALHVSAVVLDFLEALR